jgi:acyl-CoA synthetase (AMP-forming)/AMP-acid ligase II
MATTSIQNVARLLQASALHHPASPAISWSHEPAVDYAAFARKVRKLAAGLLRLKGVDPGDRVAIVMGNRPQYLEALWAAWHAGLCAVPVNAKLHTKEIAYILGHTEATICVTDRTLEPAIESVRVEAPALMHVLDAGGPAFDELAGGPEIPYAETDENAPAWIFYTSGTTGRPKGAMLTHRNLSAMALRYYADIDPVAPGDTAIVLAPLSHASGLISIPHLGRAGHHVITRGGFDPAELFDLIGRHEDVSFFAAPTMLMRIVEHPASGAVPWERVKTVFYGGAPMYVPDLLRVRERIGPRLVQGYGQGETPITITVLDKTSHQGTDSADLEERLASVGVARHGVEIRILDEKGNQLPAGAIGEIAVRSEVTMSGYWRNPDATAAALRDGWLLTGDVGSQSAAGLLTLRDRSKDVIITGGSNVYPREVEEVLLKHPAVRECSVIGRRSAEWGEDVVAVVACTGQYAGLESELDRLCIENIARFKRPKAYIFVADLPKSSYGKILKSELREMIMNIS